MKRLLTFLCALLAWCGVQAKSPVLRFGADGKFKIAQFTDVHLDLGTPERRAEADKTIAQLEYILDTEKPDLVLFTGDVVTGKPADEGWDRVLSPVAKRNVPFCVVLGNHDAEQDLTRAQIAEAVMAHKGTLNTRQSGELDDVVLTVLYSESDDPAALLYCLDSHDYSTVRMLDGYGWFTQEQIGWYRAQSAAYTKMNDNVPIPALAFFHIALPEYHNAWRNPDNSRIGRAAEDECPGVLNAGMHAAMVESGDVMGIFVGHDHDIDYVVADKGIALGYGRFSGDHTTYHNLLPGVRLLVLIEGESGFETWIRERDGRVVDHVEFSNGKVQKIKK